MAKYKPISGTLYPRGKRWWWKVKLPGESDYQNIPLNPPGSKYATTNEKAAVNIANKIWADHQIKLNPADDRRICAIIKKYQDYGKHHSDSQIYNLKWSLGYLDRVAGSKLAEDFGPLDLKALRKSLIEKDLARSTVNKIIGIIKQAFGYAVSEELIPVTTYQALLTVKDLEMGREGVREPEKVRPVADEVVIATLAQMVPVVADMVCVQAQTGARSTELCIINGNDIDRSGPIWVYQPYKHKMQWKGHDRKIMLGPKTQQIITPYLLKYRNGYFFRPADAYAQSLTRRSQSRKTPLNYGNRPGTNRKDAIKFNDCFDKDSYRRAITRACQKAFPAPAGIKGQAKKQWDKEHRWHPHQLRHTFATKVRKEFGLESAQAAIGDKTLKVAEIYAEKNMALAIEVAKKLG